MYISLGSAEMFEKHSNIFDRDCKLARVVVLSLWYTVIKQVLVYFM